MPSLSLPMVEPGRDSTFEGVLERHGLGTLTRAATTTLQINVGKMCNLACHHCHVEAGPNRTEIMTWPVTATHPWNRARWPTVMIYPWNRPGRPDRRGARR